MASPNALTPYQLSTNNAIWIDANTLLGLNGLPDRLPDETSITYSSLFNLLNCPPGARSRTFNPTYGSVLYQILQEPIDQTTTALVQLGFIQAIEKWEPRIQIDYANTTVDVDYQIPGYKVQLAYTIALTQQRSVQNFVLTQ